MTAITFPTPFPAGKSPSLDESAKMRHDVKNLLNFENLATELIRVRLGLLRKRAEFYARSRHGMAGDDPSGPDRDVPPAR